MHAESLPQEEIGLRLLRFRRFRIYQRDWRAGGGGNEARGWALAQVYWKP